MSSQSMGSGATPGAAPATDSAKATVRQVAGRRMRVSLWLAFAMMVIYATFTLLAAFAPDFLAIQVADSITLGIVLSVFVIVVSWGFSWAYIWWANRYHDVACDDLGKRRAQ